MTFRYYFTDMLIFELGFRSELFSNRTRSVDAALLYM